MPQQTFVGREFPKRPLWVKRYHPNKHHGRATNLTLTVLSRAKVKVRPTLVCILPMRRSSKAHKGTVGFCSYCTLTWRPELLYIRVTGALVDRFPSIGYGI